MYILVVYTKMFIDQKYSRLNENKETRHQKGFVCSHKVRCKFRVSCLCWYFVRGRQKIGTGVMK